MDYKIDGQYLEGIDFTSFEHPKIPVRPLEEEPNCGAGTNTGGYLSRVKLGVPTDGFDVYTSSRVKSLENLMAAMIIHDGINPDNLEGEAVDIGTGGGEGAHVLKHYGSHVIGVDILKVGLDKAGKYGILSSKDAIHEDGFTYLGKQPNESLDLITAFRIMSGFPVERLITESQRVLKKGGQLLVTATLDGREDLLRVASSGKVYTGIAPCAEATQFVYTKR